MNFKPLEFLSPKFAIIAIFTLIFIVPLSIIAIINSGITNIDTLATFIDAVFKVIALLIGALWALNRYYSTREDAIQIRVDADVSWD